MLLVDSAKGDISPCRGKKKKGKEKGPFYYQRTQQFEKQKYHQSLCRPLLQVTGNKMTSLNLATIFGPNLLHKQKSSDKEFSVQSSARAEESTAIIAVVQKMIENYEALFMVSGSP